MSMFNLDEPKRHKPTLTTQSSYSKDLADLPNRCDVGKIGNIPPQYRSRLCDSHVVAIPGFKIKISDADIRCRLIAAAGNTLLYICFDETERLQVLFYQAHMFCLIIIEIKSGSFLIRIHYTDFIHGDVPLYMLTESLLVVIADVRPRGGRHYRNHFRASQFSV